ncbi:recombinase [uncultured Mobiluncus sp.]|uniref:recombinase n=1 Tax=uncultured Mobiluncus sp. TaxID=293425 RepID=UPI002638BDA6|nr:recombinase [uncultured Mobiluncus sp.]
MPRSSPSSRPAVLAAYNATRNEIQKRKQLKTKIEKIKATLENLDTIGDFDPATFHALTLRIDITPQGEATITFKDGQSITVTA